MDGPVRVFGGEWYPEREVKFGDLPSVSRYVDRVLTHVGETVPVTVRTRKGNKFAHYERGAHTIAIPSWEIGGGWALRESVVLHEIAHHLDRSSGGGHGRSFVEHYCALMLATGHDVWERMFRIALYEKTASLL